jgi:hypothetical protein
MRQELEAGIAVSRKAPRVSATKQSPSARSAESRRPSSTIVRVVVFGALALMLAPVASASAANQYWLSNSQTVPTDHCYTGYGPGSYTDLLPTAPAGATSATFAGQAIFGCSPSFATGTTLNAGRASFDVWLTNTNKKPCTTSWFLQHNAVPSNVGANIAGTGDALHNPSITVPAGTRTPTKFTVNFYVPQTTLLPNDQLMLWLDVRTASGSCSNMTLYYGSAGTPSDLSLPTLLG